MHRSVPRWLLLTLFTLLLNGIWGALIEIPEKRLTPSFPTSLGYIVWALTFLPFNLYVLITDPSQLQFDRASIIRGLVPGLLGAGGQFLLFEALKTGPAYLVFPLVSMYPLLTILLSVILLREYASKMVWSGISLAFVAVFLLSLQEPSGGRQSGQTWIGITILVFVMWGLQSFLAKLFLQKMSEQSINFYVMLANLVFVPLAFGQTDFSQPINWQAGLLFTVIVQSFNTIAVLITPFALKKGKLIVISPLSSMAPFVTTILSLLIWQRWPYRYHSYGIAIAVIALLLISFGESLTRQPDKRITNSLKTSRP